MKLEELGNGMSHEEYLKLLAEEQLWMLYELGDTNIVPGSKALTERKQLQFWGKRAEN